MVVVYGGHGERGPEGRVVTFVRPFVAAMPIFDEEITHNLGGSAVRDDGLVEAEAHGVQQMRREPLGVAEKTMLWLERGVRRDLGSGDVELDSAVDAAGGIRREDGRGVGAGPMDGCGHQRGGLGVGADTNGGRLGVGIGRDGLGVVTDAKLGGGGCRQGGLGVGAGPGMMMDDGFGPVVNSAWAGSMQLAWASSGADGLVPTVFDGSVPTMFDGLVPMVFDGLVPTVCDGSVPMVCSSLVLAVDNGLVPTGCSAWAGSVRSVRADSDVLSVVRALQYSQMWHGMPELGGSAQWSTGHG